MDGHYSGTTEAQRHATVDTGELQRTSHPGYVGLHDDHQPLRRYPEHGYRHLHTAHWKAPVMIEERNFAQEFVMWAIGVATFAATALLWAFLERVTGFAPGYQNLMGITLIALIGGGYLMSLVRRTEWGVIRKGIIYGAYAGFIFMAVITTVSIALA